MSDPMTYAEAAALYEGLEARAAALRVRSQAGSVSRAASPRRLAYVFAACASAVTAIVAAVLISGGGAHHSPTAPNGRGQFGDLGQNGILGPGPTRIGSNPFALGGHRVTLVHASRLLGFAIPTPNTDLANPDNLSVIWFSPAGNGSGTRGEVMLDYVAGQIRISIEPANHILLNDGRGAFKTMAKELHMSPGDLTIAGAPALADGGNSANPGFAEIVQGGLDIAVMGHRSASDLIAIARSLSVTTAQG